MAAKTITYNQIATLINGANIYAPLCNINHRYCINPDKGGIGILIECHYWDNKWVGIILSVYKYGRNYMSTRYTDKYLPYVEDCVELMSEMEILKN